MPKREKVDEPAPDSELSLAMRRSTSALLDVRIAAEVRVSRDT